MHSPSLLFVSSMSEYVQCSAVQCSGGGGGGGGGGGDGDGTPHS